jgi:hypothetical protein
VGRILQHTRRIAYIGGRHNETGKGKRKKRWGGKDIFDEKFCSPRCLMGIMLPMTILMIWASPHPCPQVSAASSSVRPQPSRAARAATLSVLLKAHGKESWLIATHHIYTIRPPLPKRKELAGFNQNPISQLHIRALQRIRFNKT